MSLGPDTGQCLSAEGRHYVSGAELWHRVSLGPDSASMLRAGTVLVGRSCGTVCPWGRTVPCWGQALC